MYKMLLWDIDGVIIRHKDYFGNQLERDGYRSAVKILNDFRCTELNELCDMGSLDPVAAIKPFLQNIGWKKSSEEYFNAQYEYENQYIDDSVIEEIQKLRRLGLKNIITTNQNAYRMKHLIKRLKIYENFDEAIFSNQLGVLKTNDIFWLATSKIINRKYPGIGKDEYFFLDDMIANIECARRNGIEGKLINGINDIRKIIKEINRNG